MTKSNLEHGHFWDYKSAYFITNRSRLKRSPTSKSRKQTRSDVHQFPLDTKFTPAPYVSDLLWHSPQLTAEPRTERNRSKTLYSCHIPYLSLTGYCPNTIYYSKITDNDHPLTQNFYSTTTVLQFKKTKVHQDQTLYCSSLISFSSKREH